MVLHSGCVIGADGFGYVLTDGIYENFPQVGRVEIGDRVEIGANSCVDRAALGVTSIGDGSKLDNLVHVGHNCRIGRNVVVAAQTGFSGGVVVEDYAVIGGQVGVGDKARIESGAVVGSGSGILTSKIVRAGQPVWGTPARPLKEHLDQLAVLPLSSSAKKRRRLEDFLLFPFQGFNHADTRLRKDSHAEAHRIRNAAINQAAVLQLGGVELDGPGVTGVVDFEQASLRGAHGGRQPVPAYAQVVAALPDRKRQREIGGARSGASAHGKGQLISQCSAQQQKKKNSGSHTHPRGGPDLDARPGILRRGRFVAGKNR